MGILGLVRNKRAVLFDVDGVLVPTEALRAQAHWATVEHLGGRVSRDFYQTIGGAGKAHEQVRRKFIRESALRIREEVYSAVFQKFFRQRLCNLHPTPGIPELLRKLRRDGCRLGLVSSSPQDEVKAMLNAANLERFFSSVRVTGEHVQNKKPDPEGYQLALRRLGLTPGDAVAVEDSESGIFAAVSAGLPVIGFRHDYNLDHDFHLASNIIETF